MKKTLATLLCIMMVVCTLPVMQASAAAPASAPDNLGAAVAEAINAIEGTEKYEFAVPVTTTVNWAPCNLDFTAEGIAEEPYLTVLDNSVTFSTEEGVVFSETEGKMRYFPGEANVIDDKTQWSPTGETGYYVFSFKVAEGGKLTSWTACTSNYTVAYIDATAEDVKIKSGNGPGAGLNDDAMVTYSETPYVPGTGWNDVLIKMGNTYNPYQVWMKKATDTSFVKVAEAQYPANVAPVTAEGTPDYGFNIGFGRDCTSTNKGITFIGTNANVGYAASYQGLSDNPYCGEDIAGIIGENTASTYAFEFDATTNLANSTGRTGFTADGYKSEADGLTLVDPADTETKFTFAPFGSYSPLNGTTNWNAETYEPQALYVKAKGNFNLLIAGPKTYGRIDMAVETGKEVSAKTKTTNFSYGVTIQDEWTEYLIVPNDLTIANWISEGGYSLYVKGDKATNGIWTKVKDCAYENPTSGYSKYGLSFYKVTGHIKSARTIDLTNSVADNVSAPADVLYFEEEFDAMPQYPNVTTQGEIGEAGTMVFPTTKSSMDFKLTDVTIPVGGYAEFKVQYDGITGYRFYDGEKIVSVTQQSDYGMITGGDGFAGTTNNLWRTWRIVRGAEGYSVYSKVEGDDGWYAHSVNVGDANDHEPMVHFNFGTRNGSTPDVEEGILVGESKMDYFKVYGPALDTLTLMDGYTTKALTDGAVPAYPAEIRAMVSVDAGKLLVVSYNGKTIVNIQAIDVATEITDGVKVLDLTTTGASSIRFFLWDDFGNIEALSDDITLTF